MKVLILGAGKMAKAAAFDLANNPQVKLITIASRTKSAAQKIKKAVGSKKIKILALDISKKIATRKAMKEHDIVLSCVPYFFNLDLSNLAIQAKTHFVDLGGNHQVVKKQLKLNKQAKAAEVLIVPDAGLAPGLVSVFTKRFLEEMDKVDEVHLRVGGLPLKPKGILKYGLVFSIKGLVNEYVGKSVELKQGKKVQTQTFSGYETLKFSSPFNTVEAFVTSGGTSTLPESCKNKIKTLDYKTIRYIGHHKVLNDHQKQHGLDFKDTKKNRESLEKFISDHVGPIKEDVILLRCWAIGKLKGKKRTVEYTIIDRYDKKTGLTAMMRMTAFPAAILVSLIGSGEVAKVGATTQEYFIDARFILDELKKRGIKIQRKVF